MASPTLSLSFVEVLLGAPIDSNIPNRFHERHTQIVHVVGDSVCVAGDDQIYRLRYLSRADLEIVKRYLEGILSTPLTTVSLNQNTTPS